MPQTARARLLDLTRLVSRLGQGPLTGVDRVELAWLNRLAADPDPTFGLVRTAAGCVLLDRSGMLEIAARANGAALGPPDLIGRLVWRGQPMRARAEADVRRLGIDRCVPPLLARMLHRHIAPGSGYVNVGHANLSFVALRRVKSAGLRVTVLVHDVIPLDFPQFTRPGIPTVFARKMAAVSACADTVIHTTQDARGRTEAQFGRMGRVPPGIVAPLGVPTTVPDLAALAPQASGRYFVTLGTIEPRKNHALLLDVWDELHRRLPANEVPNLLILGARGWSNAEVFHRLDKSPNSGRTIHEIAGLADPAVAAILQGAQALLFPSLAEGYGLPPLEAAALGVPVICSNLPVYAETLADYAVYLDPCDRYSWTQMIAAWGDLRGAGQKACRTGPGWSDHFAVALACV